METPSNPNEAAHQVFYYLPAGLNETVLVDRLGPPQDWLQLGVEEGPDGGPGNMVAAPGAAIAPQIRPQNQEWHDSGEEWWFCWEKHRPPNPAGLLRTEHKPGATIRLGDGQGWIIPVPKLLPQTRRFYRGKWTQTARKADAELFEWADELRRTVWQPVNDAFAAWIAAGERMEAAEAAGQLSAADRRVNERAVDQAHQAMREAMGRLDPDVTVRILATNYRLGAFEAGVLDLLVVDPNTGIGSDWIVLDAFVDGSAIRAAAYDAAANEEKKSAEPSSSSAPAG
jgi:hypothetical protein